MKKENLSCAKSALIGGCILWLALSVGAAPLGTAFTYQGRLTDGGGPATGNYDLRFALYDALIGPAPVGTPTTITLAPVSVVNGLFTVTLDFGGAAFAGNARWLEIAVRPSGSLLAYTVLSPRQPLTPAPYALYAPSAGTATSVPWSALTGVPAGFADGLDNDTTYNAGAGLTLSGATFSIAPLSILNSMLADNAVSTAKIQNLAVSTAQLADGAVTAAKIASSQVVKSLKRAPR